MDSQQQIDFSMFNFEMIKDLLNNNNDFCDKNYTDNYQDIDLSPLFREILAHNPELKSNNTNLCENELNSVQPTAVSNDEKMLSSTSFDSLHENQQIVAETTLLNCKEKKKTFSCSTCNKIFARNSYLKKHLKTRCEEKKKTFSCSTCNKIFARNYYLKKHLKTHCEEKKKTFTCSTCNKIFARNSYLKKHLKTRCQEKTFTCFSCNKIFLRNCSLKLHMKTHTKDELTENLSSLDVNTHSCVEQINTSNINRIPNENNFCEKVKDFKRKHKEIFTPTFDNCESSAIDLRICALDLRLPHTCDEETSTCDLKEISNQNPFCEKDFKRKNQLQELSTTLFENFENNLLDLRRTHTYNEDTSTRQLKEISNQNPYYEKVKDFKRKNQLQEMSTTMFENFENNLLDLRLFLNSLTFNIEHEIKYALYEKKDLKCTFTVEAIVRRLCQDEFYSLFLQSNTILIFSEDMIRKLIDEVFDEMMNQYSQLKINWLLHKILKLEVSTTKCNSF